MIRSGSYAKANVSSRSWLQTPLNSQVESKGKKHKNVDAIVNPVFEKFSNLTSDPLWKDIFRSAAYGKFPEGFGFKDNTLFYRYRNRTSSVEIPMNAVEGVSIAHDFFQQKGGILSETEDAQSEIDNDSDRQVDDSSESGDSSKRQVDIPWSKIVPKKNRNLYLSSFVFDFGIQNRLSNREMDQLQRLLNLAESLGMFNDDNVIIRGNRIVQLTDLEFDASTRTINLKCLNSDKIPSSKRSKTHKESKEEKGLFLKLWEKYVSSYSKQIKGIPSTTQKPIKIRTQVSSKISDTPIEG